MFADKRYPLSLSPVRPAALLVHCLAALLLWCIAVLLTLQCCPLLLPMHTRHQLNNSPPLPRAGCVADAALLHTDVAPLLPMMHIPHQPDNAPPPAGALVVPVSLAGSPPFTGLLDLSATNSMLNWWVIAAGLSPRANHVMVIVTSGAGFNTHDMWQFVLQKHMQASKAVKCGCDGRLIWHGTCQTCDLQPVLVSYSIMCCLG